MTGPSIRRLPIVACALLAALAIVGCEGGDGVQGPAGPAGSPGATGDAGTNSLTERIELAAPGVAPCPNGTILTRTGQDDDGDGELADSEVDTTTTSCGTTIKSRTSG